MGSWNSGGSFGWSCCANLYVLSERLGAYRARRCDGVALQLLDSVGRQGFVRGVDVRLLHLQKHVHHVLRDQTLLLQQIQRLPNHRVAQPREILELGELDVAHRALELRLDLLDAHEARRLELRQAPPDQNLQRLLRREQSPVNAAVVHDGGADLLDGEALARVERLDAAGELVGEDVEDARAARELVGLRGVGSAAEEQHFELLRVAEEELDGGGVDVGEPVVDRLDLGELRGDLLPVGGDLGDDLGQRAADVLHQQRVEPVAEVLRAHAVAPVGVVGLEEPALVLPLQMHVLARVDVLLAAVDHAHVAQLQRDHVPVEDVAGVRALVHDVHLGDHADGALAGGIVLLRQLDRIAQGEVGVRGRDGHDDAGRLADVPNHHVAQDLLDVPRLIADRIARDAGEVDESQVYHVWRIDLEVDGLVGHADARSGFALSLAYDFVADFVKIIELLVGLVGKHRILYEKQTDEPRTCCKILYAN